VNLQQLLPDLASDLQAFHDAVVPVCLLLGFAGFIRELILVFRQRSLGGLLPYLVKMFIVFLLLAQFGTVINMLTRAVQNLNSELRLNNGNVLSAYMNALAAKYSMSINTTGTPATTQNAQDAASNPLSGWKQQNQSGSLTGVKITHYGYATSPNDPDWDYNSNVLHIGAFAGSGPKEGNSLQAGVSLAFSQDIIQEYHLQPFQTVTITLADGRTLTGRYDDKTAVTYKGQAITGRVDIYDPNNSIAFDGAAVAEINGVAPQAGFDTGVTSSPLTLFTAAAQGLDGLTVFILGLSVLLLNMVSGFLMWLASLAQQLLTGLAVAVSPLFLGFVLVRGVDSLSTRFLTSVVSICLWPLGWALANLVTTLLMGFAVNSSNNAGLGTVNFLSGGFLWWLGLCLWSLGSSLGAPWVISKAVGSSLPGLGGLVQSQAWFRGVWSAGQKASGQTVRWIGGSGGPTASVSSGQDTGAGGTDDDFKIGLIYLGKAKNFGRRPGDGQA
jgi:hypothetical protein